MDILGFIYWESGLVSWHCVALDYGGSGRYLGFTCWDYRQSKMKHTITLDQVDIMCSIFWYWYVYYLVTGCWWCCGCGGRVSPPNCVNIAHVGFFMAFCWWVPGDNLITAAHS